MKFYEAHFNDEIYGIGNYADDVEAANDFRLSMGIRKRKGKTISVTLRTWGPNEETGENETSDWRTVNIP